MMNKEIKEILELTIQFVEEELDKGTPKKDIIKAYSTQVGEAFNHIKEYITNLQEDLKYQKEMYDEYCDKHTKLMQEYSNLKKENEILNKGIEYAKRIEKDYKKRFDKAIEYIEKWRDKKTKRIDSRLKGTLNILQGSDAIEKDINLEVLEYKMLEEKAKEIERLRSLFDDIEDLCKMYNNLPDRSTRILEFDEIFALLCNKIREYKREVSK